MKKKLFSIILTVVLVISILPITILAGGGPAPENNHKVEVANCENGSIEYWKSSDNIWWFKTFPDEGYSVSNIEAKDAEGNKLIDSNGFLQNTHGVYFLKNRPQKDIVVYVTFAKNTQPRTVNFSCNDEISLELDGEIDGFSLTDNHNNTFTLTIAANKTIPDTLSFNVVLPEKKGIKVTESGGITLQQGHHPWEDFITLDVHRAALFFINDANENYSVSLETCTSENADSIYSEITDNGDVEIDSVTDDHEWLLEFLNMDLANKNIWDYSYGGSDNLYIFDKGVTYNYKVNLKLKTPNETIKNEIKKIKLKLQQEVKSDNNVLFSISDLEMLNYLINTTIDYKPEYVEGFFLGNMPFQFSGDFRKLTDNANFGIELSVKYNFISPFYYKETGKALMTYDGILYDGLDNIGVEGFNIIYVPDNTLDNTADYINAAKTRIENYLGKEVTITEKGQLTSFANANWYGNIIDKDKMLDQYYTITIDDKTFDYLIAKDSSKIISPKMITTDMITDASIETDSSEVPLDSNIRISDIEEGTEEYEKIVSKIGLTDAEIYDISLFSNTTGTNIKKLSNGLFEVRIPLKNNNYDKKKLKAYYIREDGTVEIHDVEVKGGNAYFTTDHFSTYSIGEDINASEGTTKEEAKETPKTADLNMAWVFAMLALISLAAIGVIILRRKTYNK